MNVFELFGTIAINNSDANRKIEQTGKLANTLGTIFKKVGTVVATVFAVDKIKDFGNACAQTYATIAAENSAFAQIMGDYGDIAKEKMQKVADETGVVASRLTPYMTSMTAKFKGLGYDIDEATTLATEGLTIASDAAAFWDKSLDESMSHLNSFINGSYEGGEAIGLFANDTQMAAYAVEQRIISETKAWAKLDEATKQATRMQYAKEMYKQSGATGQAAKESGEYANVLANLKERWRQLQGVIGQPIMQKIVLPTLQKLNKLMPSLTERIKGITEKATAGLETIASYFTDVFTESGIDLSAVPDAFSRMFSDFTQKIPVWISKAGTKLSNALENNVWPYIRDFLSVEFGVELPEWSVISGQVTALWESVKGSCEWLMRLTGIEPWTEEDDKAVQNWWKDAGVVFKWALGMPTAEEDTQTIKDIKTWWDNNIKKAAEAIATIRINVLEPVTDWVTSVLDKLFPGDGFSEALNYAKEGKFYHGEVTWEELSAGIPYTKTTWDELFTELGLKSGKEANGESNVHFVPVDGFMSDRLGSLSSVGANDRIVTLLNKLETISNNSNGTDIAYAVAAAVRQSVAGIQFNVTLDSGVLVGQLAPKIDAQLGTISIRKVRGN